MSAAGVYVYPDIFTLAEASQALACNVRTAHAMTAARRMSVTFMGSIIPFRVSGRVWFVALDWRKGRLLDVP